jgi:hypothetical protein
MTLPPRSRSSDAASQTRLTRKFRVFYVVAAIVLLLSILKAGVHWFGLEFLTLNALLTSGIAGAIFVLGFLLSSVLSDYKEAERIPAEIRVALDAIHGDVSSFAASNEKVNVSACRTMLKNIVHLIRVGLSDAHDHINLRPALDQVEGLNRMFIELEQLGFPANYIVRLRTAQDSLRRAVSRIYHIQKIQFVPSVHILAQSLVVSIVSMLLFLKTEGSPESALMFGFICYLFVYALYLIQLLEQPFRKGHNTLDDVSLFLLSEFAEQLGNQENPPACSSLSLTK